MRSFLRQGLAQLAPSHVFATAETEGSAAWSSARVNLLWLWSGIPGVESFPKDYKLLVWEDLGPWVVFLITFIALILFDNVVLHRHDHKLSFKRALLLMCFWLGCAGVFCLYILMIRGPTDAFDWATGYLLEWMLSVDNLFVFRSIFMVFKTPDDQKHKPLFWGIVGAVIFRMLFFVIEEFLVHTFSWMYILLGIFLVYTGVKVVVADEEEANPRESPLYNRIIRYLPYNDRYSSKARFFDRVPVENHSSREVAGDAAQSEVVQSSRLASSARSGVSYISSARGECNTRLVATRLTLVVICLEVTDIVFAVDSVSAIVAQIPDLFLAYTACVFAMLGLRATFFVVDELVALFSLLPYAVGGILVFLGVKLILRRWVHIPPEYVCLTLFSLLFFSVIGSVIFDRYQGKSGFEECCEAVAGCSSKGETDQEELDHTAVSGNGHGLDATKPPSASPGDLRTQTLGSKPQTSSEGAGVARGPS